MIAAYRLLILTSYAEKKSLAKKTKKGIANPYKDIHIHSDDLQSKRLNDFISDAYYKTLTSQKQFIALPHIVIIKCNSFNIFCTNLQFLENKSLFVRMPKLSSRSILSDGNYNRIPEFLRWYLASYMRISTIKMPDIMAIQSLFYLFLILADDSRNR